jgi:Flp pilus assembly pilin Flp
MFFKKLFRDKRGSAMVEYGLLVAGVAIIGVGAVSTFGKKTGDLIGTSAAIIPGGSAATNRPIAVGRLIEMETSSEQKTNFSAINNNTTTAGVNRLSRNLAGTSVDLALVKEPVAP